MRMPHTSLFMENCFFLVYFNTPTLPINLMLCQQKLINKYSVQNQGCLPFPYSHQDKITD